MTDRGKATRAKLIEATVEVVRDVGYAHASTRAIAEAAGVAEGTIYRHFPDKASLYFAAALESNAPVVAWVEGLPQRAGQDSVEANLTDALGRLATLQGRLLPLELAIIADPELAAQRSRVLAAHEGRPPGPPEAIAAYLAEEQRLGRVRPDLDPMEVAIVLLAALLGLGIASSDRGARIDKARITALVRLFIDGIAPAT